MENVELNHHIPTEEQLTAVRSLFRQQAAGAPLMVEAAEEAEAQQKADEQALMDEMDNFIDDVLSMMQVINQVVNKEVHTYNMDMLMSAWDMLGKHPSYNQLQSVRFWFKSCFPGRDIDVSSDKETTLVAFTIDDKLYSKVINNETLVTETVKEYMNEAYGPITVEAFILVPKEQKQDNG